MRCEKLDGPINVGVHHCLIILDALSLHIFISIAMHKLFSPHEKFFFFFFQIHTSLVLRVYLEGLELNNL